MAEEEFAPIEVYLTIDGAAEACTWYEKAFGAETTYRMPTEDGTKLMHANVSMFGGQIMLSDVISPTEQQTDDRVDSPLALGGASVTIHIQLKDPAEVDRVVARAEAAGARVTMAPADMFWGARYARLRDPFGHAWGFNAPISKND